MKVLHRNSFAELVGFVESLLKMFHRVTQSLANPREENRPVNLVDNVKPLTFYHNSVHVRKKGSKPPQKGESFFSFTLESMETEELNRSISRMDISQPDPENTTNQEWSLNNIIVIFLISIQRLPLSPKQNFTDKRSFDSACWVEAPK